MGDGQNVSSGRTLWQFAASWRNLVQLVVAHL
jgi:hypothetical protein